MSRKLSWGVAVGATLLISVSACSQQQPGQAGAGPTNVCGLVAAPVTAQLVKAGITATPVSDASTSACRWQDQASATTVTLSTANTGGKDGQAAETTTVPGAGTVQVVGPGEVTFTAADRPWDLKVESKNSGDVNTQTATALVATISAALGGGGTAGATPAPAGSASTGSASTDSASAGTQATDSTVTVTDTDDRVTDLRTSSIGTTAGGGNDLDLGNGQTVLLTDIAKITFVDTATGDSDVTVTTTAGKQATGSIFHNQQLSGDSDFGPWALEFKNIKTVDFRRDTPFVATPDPTTLNAFDSAIATVTETDGKVSKVKAPSLAFSGDSITLGNGQTVKFTRITDVAAAPLSDGTKLTLTLVNGKTVAGTVNRDLPFTGDAEAGPLTVVAGNVQTIKIDRGTSGN